jgi:hypothetical protein
MSAIKKHRPAQGVMSVSFFAGYTCLRMALLMVAAALVVGCATTKAFTPPQLPGDGRALVYFIRDGYGDGNGEAKVAINNVQVATLANDDFVAVNVPIGINYIEVALRNKKPFDFTLHIDGAEKIYISLKSTDKILGFGNNDGRLALELSRHVDMQRISESEAQAWATRAHKNIYWWSASPK